jgi:transposase InsO family protein
VLDALDMALGQRHPEDVIHHSDQRSQQYTSIAIGQRCVEAGVRPSMGSVGDCYEPSTKRGNLQTYRRTRRHRSCSGAD